MALQKIWLSSFFFFASASAFSLEPPSYKTKEIRIGAHKLRVAIADDDEKRAKGMMFVENWSKFDGMLFIFDEAQIRRFWMKNTLLPLSLGFFDQNKKLIQTAELKPPKSIAQTEFDYVLSKKKAQYVLELPTGWFKDKKIKLGTVFKEL